MAILDIELEASQLQRRFGRPAPIFPHPWSARSALAILDRRVAAGLIVFGDDETTVPKRKSFLNPEVGQIAKSVFERDRRGASKRLASLLGEKVFDFPKDEIVLARWIDLVTQSKRDALILDFFAGSGSTGHAVMNLNAADGGNRRFILVQLDELVDKDDYATIADITRERLRRAGRQIASKLTLDTADIDTGFRAYHLAPSNVKAWDGTADQLNLVEAADNLVAGRTADDLLVEMMLRLGVDLTTPLETRQVAGSTLYNLAGTLFAYFGTGITVNGANEVTKALVAWRDEDTGDADTTVVVRDTGFLNSAAKLNFAAALEQAGFTTLRSI